MLLKEEMKNKPFVKVNIKEEQQTDGSCNRQTDSTSLESEDYEENNEVQKKFRR